MSRQGRKPKPSALRDLEGDVSHRPRNDREPKPNKAMPPKPDGLSAEAAKAWDRLAPELYACGLLTVLDGDQLESYAHLYALARRCWEGAAADGPVVMIAGKPEPNPFVKEALKAEDRLHKLRQTMGLTPVDRVRIKVDTPEQHLDDLDSFLRIAN